MNPDVYAVIQGNLVVNIQLLTAQDSMNPQFIWVVITNLLPQPGIGWVYDGQNFNAPASQQPQNPPPPIQATVQVADPLAQAVLTDILNTSLNGDPSYVQKYNPNNGSGK